MQLRTLVDNLCHVYNEGTLPEEAQKGNVKKKSHAKKKSYASTRVESLDGTLVDLHKKPPALLHSTGGIQAVNPSMSNRKLRKQKVNEAISDDSAFKKRQPVVNNKETSTKKHRAILSKTEVGLVADDPYVGKVVAYPCNGCNGKQIMSTLQKEWDSAAICYQLDASKGLVVGSAMRKVTPRGKVKKACHSYEIIWEFTGLGMSIMEVPAVVEGINEGEQLVAERLRAEKDTISNKPKPSRVKGQKLNATSIHNKLCEGSDDDDRMEALHYYYQWAG